MVDSNIDGIIMYLIVGLGNPGKKYAKTRHNVGFMALDLLLQEFMPHRHSDWRMDKKFKAEIAGGTYKGKRFVLLKPQTYMNASGESVRAVTDYYKIPVENVLVVHDDKDIALGTMKMQFDRSAAGHNGIKSMIQHLRTQAFYRLRVGVASKNEKKMADMGKFVLGKFGLFEKSAAHKALHDAVNLMGEWLEKQK